MIRPDLIWYDWVFIVEQKFKALLFLVFGIISGFCNPIKPFEKLNLVFKLLSICKQHI